MLETVSSLVRGLLSMESYVLFPAIMLVVALLFRMKPKEAFLGSLTISIGLIGIFMVFAYFVKVVSPAVEALIARTGLALDTLDVGWTPFAMTAWAFWQAPLMVLGCVALNAVMLLTRLTRTINLDIWNIWHMSFCSLAVRYMTGNTILGYAAGLAMCAVVLKLSDFSQKRVEAYTGLRGISSCTISNTGYYAWGLLGNDLLAKIPRLGKISLNAASMNKKLGLFGEMPVLGLLVGILIAVLAGSGVVGGLTLAVQVAAVTMLLPVMCGVLNKGLFSIVNFVKERLSASKRFSDCIIGMDGVFLVGEPSVVVTALILMPVSLGLAFVLPGVRFLPLGDWANIMGAVSFVVLATRGNIVRSVLIFLPVIVGKLYLSSYFTPMYTDLLREAGAVEAGTFSGYVTSFLDGGNFLKVWFMEFFSGNLWAMIALPAVLALLLYAWKKRNPPAPVE